MRYYLAVDKGGSRKLSERYVTLNLNTINPNLSVNNNLSALAKFTCTFNNERELKKFLIDKGILYSKNLIYDLVIYYEIKGQIRILELSYKCDEYYMNISKLSENIMKMLKSKTFLQTLISAYKKYYFLYEELGLIKEYANDPYLEHKCFDAVNRFVNRLCYNSKGNINYRTFYELSLFISKLSNKNRTKDIAGSNELLNTTYERRLSEVDEYEKEWLEYRKKYLMGNDDQMTFKL